MLFNTFLGTNHFAGRSYYGGHYGTNNDNHYSFFSASGMDFIVVYLEYDTSANAAVLAWANGLLQTYSDRRAIVVSSVRRSESSPSSSARRSCCSSWAASS